MLDRYDDMLDRYDDMFGRYDDMVMQMILNPPILYNLYTYVVLKIETTHIQIPYTLYNHHQIIHAN